MDQNSLPMVPDLEAFPRVVRLLFVGAVVFFVGLFVLAVLVGVFSA
jgi:hypothetical protein